MIVFYLLESLISEAVQHTRYYVNVVGSLYYGIYESVACGTLHLYVEAHNFEYKIHGILEIQFGIAHDLITGIGKKSLHTTHELLHATGLHITNKLLNN